MKNKARDITLLISNYTTAKVIKWSYRKTDTWISGTKERAQKGTQAYIGNESMPKMARIYNVE